MVALSLFDDQIFRFGITSDLLNLLLNPLIASFNFNDTTELIVEPRGMISQIALSGNGEEILLGSSARSTLVVYRKSADTIWEQTQRLMLKLINIYTPWILPHKHIH